MRSVRLNTEDAAFPNQTGFGKAASCLETADPRTEALALLGKAVEIAKLYGMRFQFCGDRHWRDARDEMGAVHD
mgnify:CR=1 FL=1